MSRVDLTLGDQTRFLEAVKRELDPITWERIARICGIERHTLQSWRKEKHRITYEALLHLHELSGVPLPQIRKIIPEDLARSQSARIAALARLKIYGPPGTPEGRRKGAQVSRQRRLEHPELYQDTFKWRKTISEPEVSSELAELVGILLGDGEITDYQVKVTLNRAEAEYGEYVAHLMNQLFRVRPSVQSSLWRNTTKVALSSVGVVEYLERIGLKRGHKVRQQVSVPEWVFASRDYIRACVRGLIDTDGTICLDKQDSGGRTYHYLLLSFSSHSRPLRDNVERMLTELGFTPKHPKGVNVALHRQEEIHRYFAEVGTNNPYHWARYRQFSTST